MASADLITAVHSSGRQIVLAVTGGGGRALSDLLDVPGASRSVLEAIVPYSDASLAQWLGAAPEQACSESTARAMAMASLVRARRLAPQTEPERLLGVGCSASLATNRPKRGEHRIHVGVQTIHETTAYTL
ncbi:MAG TPA: CinA family protein, partial [Lacipirellulaceae bacterium]|nr:CinA family protein [Lacipirellulaceae bacterium]